MNPLFAAAAAARRWNKTRHDGPSRRVPMWRLLAGEARHISGSVGSWFRGDTKP